jgi:hypothetical protein
LLLWINFCIVYFQPPKRWPDASRSSLVASLTYWILYQSPVMDKEPSPECPFCAVNLTIDHMLWHCKETEMKRLQMDFRVGWKGAFFEIALPKNFCILFFFFLPDLATKPPKILWFGLKLTILAIFTRNAIFLMIFCLFRIESSLNAMKKR